MKMKNIFQNLIERKLFNEPLSKPQLIAADVKTFHLDTFMQRFQYYASCLIRVTRPYDQRGHISKSGCAT